MHIHPRGGAERAIEARGFSQRGTCRRYHIFPRCCTLSRSSSEGVSPRTGTRPERLTRNCPAHDGASRHDRENSIGLMCHRRRPTETWLVSDSCRIAPLVQRGSRRPFRRRQKRVHTPDSLPCLRTLRRRYLLAEISEVASVRDAFWQGRYHGARLTMNKKGHTSVRTSAQTLPWRQENDGKWCVLITRPRSTPHPV